MIEHPPAGFRGDWRLGDEAARLARQVSGPFTGTPLAWAAPAGAESLQALLRYAADTGTPLIARGAGTGMPGGNLGPGIIVSMAGSGAPSLSPTRRERVSAAASHAAPHAASHAASHADGFLHLGPVEVNPEVEDGVGGRIRVGAAIPAALVDAQAADHGLTFPPLPSSARWATVGGMVANNAAGARSFGYGAVASWVEAVEGVTADGEWVVLRRGASSSTAGLSEAVARALPSHLPRGWPRVRKNSSGYGLDRWLTSGDAVDLAVGSEGTILFVTHVTLRLAPRLPTRGLALVSVPGDAEAGAMARAAEELGASACEFLGRRLLEMMELDQDPELGSLVMGARALFLLEFEGADADGVHEALSRADACGRSIAGRAGIVTVDPGLAERLWALRHRASPLIAEMARQGLHSTQFIEDSVVPPGALGAYLAGVDRILQEEGRGMDAVVFGHAGDGNVHVNPLVDTSDPAWRDRVRDVLTAVAELVAGLGGTLAGEHGDGRLRAPLLDSIWSGEAVRDFRRLKDAFDPAGILNPGVILPLPGQDPLEGLRPGPRGWPG